MKKEIQYYTVIFKERKVTEPENLATTNMDI